MTAPSRPVIRWHGGKWLLAPWIIEHFPAHRVYVEPYGGGASVLMQKTRAYAEIYNDLDEDVVNLFEVLRSPRAGELVEMLRLTPFSRLEFERTYQEEPEDVVERARLLVSRAYMGFGTDGHNKQVLTGFRANVNRSYTTPAHDWANLPDAYVDVVKRMFGVVVECKSALAVMKQHDSATTLHYVDPPYLPETRSTKSRRKAGKYRAYNHEMTKADHVELLQFMCKLEGFVVLSGYPSKLYDQRLRKWRRIETEAMADGARPRIEVLWVNPRCADALDRECRAPRQLELIA